MNKNLKTMLTALGPNYRVKRIDMEDCPYRDLGDFDIEISGCRKRKGPFHVFVWQKSPLTIVHRKLDLKSIATLKRELSHIEEMNEARKHNIKWPEEK